MIEAHLAKAAVKFDGWEVLDRDVFHEYAHLDLEELFPVALLLGRRRDSRPALAEELEEVIFVLGVCVSGRVHIQGPYG